MTAHDKAVRALKDSGYQRIRGKKHEIYYNAELNRAIPLKNHDFNENDLKYILKEIDQNRKLGRA